MRYVKGLSKPWRPFQCGARQARISSTPQYYVLRYCPDVEINRSARRHDVSDAAILHALDHAVTVIDLDPDADPPKVLAIGPDHAGNLLEVIWLELADEVSLVIHAMPLRPTFYDLLPQTRKDMP